MFYLKKDMTNKQLNDYLSQFAVWKPWIIWSLCSAFVSKNHLQFQQVVRTLLSTKEEVFNSPTWILAPALFPIWRTLADAFPQSKTQASWWCFPVRPQTLLLSFALPRKLLGSLLALSFSKYCWNRVSISGGLMQTWLFGKGIWKAMHRSHFKFKQG